MAAGEIDRVRQLVVKRCGEAGISYAKLSELIGKNSTYVQQWVKDGSPRNLSDDNLTIIANALGLSETDLRYRNGEYRMPSLRGQRHTGKSKNGVGFPTNRRSLVRTYRRFIARDEMLPVYKLVLTPGNHDVVFSVASEPVDQIAMPQPLMGVPGAYAFMITHDLAHIPMMHSGDTVLVNSVLPPRKDDVCVLRRPFKDASEIFICHVCEATSDTLIVSSRRATRQSSHKLKRETIKRADWPDVAVVVGLYLRR